MTSLMDDVCGHICFVAGAAPFPAAPNGAPTAHAHEHDTFTGPAIRRSPGPSL